MTDTPENYREKRPKGYLYKRDEDMALHCIEETIRPTVGRLRNEDFIVPKGIRVEPCDDNSGEYFVDELGWLNAYDIHDAEYYGIRVKAIDVGPRYR